MTSGASNQTVSGQILVSSSPSLLGSGDVLLETGTSRVGHSGALLLTTGNSNLASGSITLAGGSSAAGPGAQVAVSAGEALDGVSSGGGLTVAAGQGSYGGSLELRGGSGVAGDGGEIVLAGGSAARGTGSDVRVSSGSGELGGGIEVVSGSGSSDSGGSLSITSGISDAAKSGDVMLATALLQAVRCKFERGRRLVRDWQVEEFRLRLARPLVPRATFESLLVPAARQPVLSRSQAARQHWLNQILWEERLRSQQEAAFKAARSKWQLAKGGPKRVGKYSSRVVRARPRAE